jgi:RNA polymerase sigma factor (TIGR02999 family)
MTESDVTRLLGQVAAGNGAAREELFRVVYEDLKRLGRQALRGQQGKLTLQPTVLVHEAYLRLVRQSRADFKNRAHFFAIAGLLIRRVLVDEVRARRTRKRASGGKAVEFTETAIGVEDRDVDLLDLHGVLEVLERTDPQAARVVEMRYFAGLTNDEVAEVLGVSRRTVIRLWSFAKAFLYRELEGGAAGG